MSTLTKLPMTKPMAAIKMMCAQLTSTKWGVTQPMLPGGSHN
jgi:hypothetical protein